MSPTSTPKNAPTLGLRSLSVGYLGLASSLLLSSTPMATADSSPTASVSIQPDKIIATTRDNRLLGGNIALWYNPELLTELDKSPYYKQWNPGLISIPGGSWSDEFYWNGNGVRNGRDSE